MGRNKKKNKSIKPTAEVAANPTLGSKDSPRNRNDPPARNDGNKPKEAGKARPNAYDPSKIKGTEVTLIIPDEDLNKTLYFSGGSRNKVQVGFRPVQPSPPVGVENATPRRNDESKNPHPATVLQPGNSPVRKSPNLKTKGVSTSVAQRGESSVLKFHDLKQKEAKKGAKLIGIRCETCHVERRTKPLLQAFRCKHYFCLGCFSGITHLHIELLGRNFDPAAVGCPVKSCPKNRFPKDIRENLILFHRNLLGEDASK